MNIYSKHFFRNFSNDYNKTISAITRYCSLIMLVLIAYAWMLFPNFYIIPFYVIGIVLCLDFIISQTIIEIVKEEGDDIRAEIWCMKYKGNKQIYMGNPYTNYNKDELEELYAIQNKLPYNKNKFGRIICYTE